MGRLVADNLIKKGHYDRRVHHFILDLVLHYLDHRRPTTSHLSSAYAGKMGLFCKPSTGALYRFRFKDSRTFRQSSSMIISSSQRSHADWRKGIIIVR